MKTFIAYYRVSTEKQGRSGLGLEAQREAVQQYAQGGRIMAEYTEVESGRDDNRKELAKALRHAQAIGAVLLVAKLDRLARSVYFLSCLQKSEVDFIACDNPHANKFMLQVMMAFAEHEAGMISSRIKAALQAKRLRGEPVGAASPNYQRRTQADMRAVGRASAEARLKASNEHYARVAEFAGPLVSSGKSHREIAEELNENGFTTPRGMPWGRSQVARLLSRMEQ